MRPGASVRVRFTKWGGGRHWEYAGEYLGSDEYGHWVGFRPPTVCVRPGRTVRFEHHFVVLFPVGAWYSASFNERTEPLSGVDVYVDINTIPVWSTTNDGEVVTAADLDLDVVRRWDGTVFVDDEDEFAEHQVSLGYPDEVIRHAERSCTEVERAVSSGQEPFRTVGAAWLTNLTTRLT